MHLQEDPSFVVSYEPLYCSKHVVLVFLLVPLECLPVALLVLVFVHLQVHFPLFEHTLEPMVESQVS